MLGIIVKVSLSELFRQRIERKSLPMNLKHRAAAALLCLALICTPAFAAETETAADADASAVFETFFETYDAVFDDGLNDISDGQKSLLKELLAEKLKEYDPASLAEDLKALLAVSADLTDDALRSAIDEAAKSRGITLKDSQLQQLVDLCRTLEKLNPDELKNKVGDLQKLTNGLSETKGFLSGAGNFLRNAFSRIGSGLRRLFSSIF